MVRVTFLAFFVFVSSLFGQKQVFFSVDNTGFIWKQIQVSQLEQKFALVEGIEFSYKSASGNIAQQVIDLEQAIKDEVDLIIVSPVHAEIVVPVIEKAYEMGIKIIFAIRSAKTQKYHTHIAPDDRMIAARAAEYILSRVSEPKTVMIQGRIGADTVTNRREGFLEVYQNHPNASIVALKVGNYNPDEALMAMDEVLQSGVEFNSIYTHNDAMQEGVRVALVRHGVDFEDVVLVGIDYIQDAKEAIGTGQMDATFTYPTGAVQIVEAVQKLLQGKAVEKNMCTPSQLMTIENIDRIEPLF